MQRNDITTWERKKKDVSETFVIVGACNGSGNVAWYNGDHSSSEKSSTSILLGKDFYLIFFFLKKKNQTIATFISERNGTNRTGSVRKKGTDLELLGEVVGDDGSEGGEERCKEHAHVSDVDGDMEEVQHVVQGRRGHHQTCTAKSDWLTLLGWKFKISCFVSLLVLTLKVLQRKTDLRRH